MGLFAVAALLASVVVVACAATQTSNAEVFGVQLRAGVDADHFASEHGYKNLGRVESSVLHNVYRFERLPAARTRSGRASSRLTELPEVQVAEKQVRRLRAKRVLETVTDPEWPRQWHLHGTSVSLNAQGAWALNVTGRNAQVCIVDDGIEPTHVDLAGHYNAAGSFDFNFNRADPSPYPFDNHGTSAAGCASAISNFNCGVGVAPGSSVSGIRLIAEATTDLDEANGLSYRLDINHIMSSSWGPIDDGRRLEGPKHFLMSAFEQGVRTGRQGKGTIYVWAAGNGRSARDNCNYDGYANNRFTIPIGAIQSTEKVAYYSEPCAKLFAVVPSSGGPSGPITTITLRNGCMRSFGGTSAAAPMFAGVVALMLEANPALTWRDVQHIVARGAIKNDASDPDWIVNGAGFNHNHNYGFGRIDAARMVTLARAWQNVGPSALPIDSGVVQPNVVIPADGSEASGSFVVSAAAAANISAVEWVGLTFQATHPRRGDLEVYLISPSGTKSALALARNDGTQNYPAEGWTFGTVRNWGESPVGTWRVVCKNYRPQQGLVANFNWFKLAIHGYKK